MSAPEIETLRELESRAREGLFPDAPDETFDSSHAAIDELVALAARLAEAERQRDAFAAEDVERTQRMVDLEAREATLREALEGKIAAAKVREREHASRAGTPENDYAMYWHTVGQLAAYEDALAAAPSSPAASVRSQAVENVDAHYGYTAEYSNAPNMHRHEYDEEEARLTASLSPAATPVQPNLSPGSLSSDGQRVTAHNSVDTYTFPSPAKEETR